MNEQTGMLVKLQRQPLEKLVKQVDHVHRVPDELQSDAENLAARLEKLKQDAAVAMTGDGELSQWRQDLARKRRNRKTKARAARKRHKRKGNDA